MRITQGEVTAAQVKEYYNDWKRLNKKEQMSNVKSAEPYQHVVNNPLSRMIFDWCAEKSFNEFLFSTRAFRNTSMSS